MKISVIMVDGSFRENVHAAKYFSDQDFPSDQYEVIWIEYYRKIHPDVLSIRNVKSLYLNRSGEYHSSFCFNEGIRKAKGELLVIPDADVMVKRDFLTNLWRIHEKFDELACYVRRYDEPSENFLDGSSFEEMDSKCLCKNPSNYGGCLSVRKKWLSSINGYDLHPVFSTGFHANGLDIYVRLKNLGLSIMWAPTLKLYHPWHPYTGIYDNAYDLQKKFIREREVSLEYMAHFGIDKNKDLSVLSYDAAQKQYDNDRLFMRRKSSGREMVRKVFKKSKKAIKNTVKRTIS